MCKVRQEDSMGKFFDSAISAIKQAIQRDYSGNVSQAARALGVSVPTLHTWIRGDRKPSLEKLSPILDALGAQISLPSDNLCKDVCFISPRLVPAGEHATPPKAEDYIAAPLVGEVGAGAGYIPQEGIQAWFLVHKNLPAVRYRRNLLAVEIGKYSRSMEPTFSPGDIVLVDRDDRDVQQPGHMMLVTDPDGNGMIKRVSVDDKNNGDFRIIFYSDNAAKYPPDIYNLREDYFGDWDRVIIGRVIWALSDVRNK